MLRKHKKQNILNWCYSLDAKPKHGDYIRVDDLTEKNICLIGTFFDVHDSGTEYLIDFKLMDSSEWHTVLSIIPIERCEIITEEEFFLWRLKGRGVGLYA